MLLLKATSTRVNNFGIISLKIKKTPPWTFSGIFFEISGKLLHSKNGTATSRNYLLFFLKLILDSSSKNF